MVGSDELTAKVEPTVCFVLSPKRMRDTNFAAKGLQNMWAQEKDPSHLLPFAESEASEHDASNNVKFYERFCNFKKNLCFTQRYGKIDNNLTKNVLR